MESTTTAPPESHATPRNVGSMKKDAIHSNKYLSMAWHAATVGLNANYSRLRRRFKRNHILTFDIPKLCEMLCEEDVEGTEQQQQQQQQQPTQQLLLGTKAKLLYGVSNIMRYQSQYLYEDSVTLSNKLKHVLTKNDKDNGIDMEKPFASLNTITLADNDDLLDYVSSTDAPAFSYLFNDRHLHPGQRDYDLNELEESICSILHLTDTSTLIAGLEHTGGELMNDDHITRPGTYEATTGRLRMSNAGAGGSTGVGGPSLSNLRGPETATIHGDTGDEAHFANNLSLNEQQQQQQQQQYREPAEEVNIFADIVDYGDESNMNADEMAAAMEQYNAHELFAESNDLQQQNDLRQGDIDNANSARASTQNILRRSAGPHTAASNAPITTNSSGSTLSTPSYHSYNNDNNAGNIGGLFELPSLIPEEDDNDMNSISTDQFSFILPLELSGGEGSAGIMASPIPPARRRPRLVRRMMMAREEDTMIVPFLEDTSSITMIDSSIDNVSNGAATSLSTAAADRLRVEQTRHALLNPMNIFWSLGWVEINRRTEAGRVRRGREGVPTLATATGNNVSAGLEYHEFCSLFFRRSRKLSNQQLNMEAGRTAAFETSRRFDHRRDSHQNLLFTNQSNSSNNTSGHLSLRSHSGLHTPDAQHHLNNLEAGGGGGGEGTDSERDQRERDNLYWQQRFHFENDDYDIISNGDMSNHDENNVDQRPFFDLNIDDDEDYDNYNADNEAAADAAVTESGDADISHHPLSDLYSLLLNNAPPAEPITSEELFENKPRSQVAATFYNLLRLASNSRIRVHQREPFGSIDVVVMPSATLNVGV